MNQNGDLFYLKLVLASSSPFRKQLLQRLQLDFITASPDIDERKLDDESPREYVNRLAIEKAKELAPHHPQALIIGSDQVLLTQDGQIQGKPLTHANAVKQLQCVRGTQALLITGLALYNSQTTNIQSDIIDYRIGYRDYSDAEIENYLEQEKPYNCAGSLKSEGLGTVLLSQLSGDDPTAVIGLPLIRLTEMLLHEGYPVLS